MTARDITAAAQAHAREQERIARHDAALAKIAERIGHLSAYDARCLAFHLFAAIVAQVIGVLPEHHDFTQRMIAVVDLARRFAGLLADRMAPAAWWAELHRDADRLHARFFAPSRVRDRWPLEERIPADLAEMVRRATAPVDVFNLSLIVHDARAMVADHGLLWAPCEDAIRQALLGATLPGLDGLVHEAAAEPKADAVLQAPHVACGAGAVEALRVAHEGAHRSAAERMHEATTRLAAAVPPAVAATLFTPTPETDR